MDPPPPTRLEFEQVCIDLAGRRLWRDGVAQALEPKAFGVLALLAQSPGRAFTRDEILDAVWGHRHVTPGVLNRVMTLLRHALGEDAHSPRYLHTVHGVGYRFDRPVTHDAGAAAPDAPPAVPATAAVVERPVVTAGEDARRASVRPVPGWPPWAWLLPVLAVLAFAGWKLWPGSAPPAAPVSDAPVATARDHAPTLVVVPLRAINTDSGTRVIADGLSEELICSLSRIQGLRVIAHESTRRLGAQPAAGQAPQLGITHLLEGNLQQSGQKLRVRLRMAEAGSGRLLWAREFDRDASESLSLQRDIADVVATSLTLNLGLPAPSQPGGDAEYQRRFLEARLLAMRFDLPASASIDLAETRLRTLAAERPDDARTRAWLALALRLRGLRRPQMQPLLAEDAVREARRALQLDSARYEPYLVLAADDCRHQRWEPCMARLDRALALAPGLSYVHYDRAAALASLGYLEQAETHARESVLRDPLNPVARHQLARVLDARGKHAEAAPFLQDAAPGTLQARWFNAVWRNDQPAALRLAQAQATAGPADPETARLGPSIVAVTRARAAPAAWPQARAELQRYERDNPGQPNFAGLFAPDAEARADALAAQLVSARKRGQSGIDLLLWAKGFKHLRRTPAFARYLRDSGLLDYWHKHGFPPQCRPHGSGADCH